MKIYKMVYDNPMDDQGREKPNELLGHFEIIEGNMDAYSYEVYVKNYDGEVYLLVGKEVSYANGGTRHFLTKLKDVDHVHAYRKYVLKEKV